MEWKNKNRGYQQLNFGFGKMRSRRSENISNTSTLRSARSAKVFPATMLTGRQTNSLRTISKISIAKRSEWKIAF